MGFFTIVLIVLVVLWLLRRLLPYLLLGLIARKQKQFTEQFQGQARQRGDTGSSKDQRKEGDIKVEINPETHKEGKSKTIGEYVEFEEE